MVYRLVPYSVGVTTPVHSAAAVASCLEAQEQCRAVVFFCVWFLLLRKLYRYYKKPGEPTAMVREFRESVFIHGC